MRRAAPATPCLRRFPRRLAAPLLAASLLLSCGGAERPPLSLGINPWPGYEHFYLAQELGFFAAAGVDARIVEFTSLADTRRAFERGQLDGMFATLVELLQARQNCPRLPQVVLVTDYSNGGDALIAGPGVDGLVDLRGRRVGVEPGSLNCFLLARALESVGIADEEVVSVPMSPLAMEAALAQGSVDAIVAYPPVSVNLLADPRRRLLFSSADIPGEVVDVLCVDSQVLAERGDDVKRLLAAYGRALDWAEEHPAEALAIMARREGLAPQEFEDILENDIRVVDLDGQAPFFVPGGLIERACAGTEDVLRKAGHLDGPPRAVGPVTAGPFAAQGASSVAALSAGSRSGR
jgi:NitT/TauT family transport system substrate-binding protein